jgi:HD domain-containing protein
LAERPGIKRRTARFRVSVGSWHIFPTAGRRRFVSFLLGALATAALLPAFPLLAPESSWSPAPVAVALLAIALIGNLNAFRSREVRLQIDTDFTVVLLAVVLLGPLPALVIWIASAGFWLALRRPPLHGILATVASFGWAVLAASLVLNAITSGDPVRLDTVTAYPAIALAGVTLLSANFVIARGIFAVIGLGRSLVATVAREFVDPLPGTCFMLALGIATAYLYTEIGVLAFAAFSLITIVPQALLPLLLKRRLVADLEHTEAVAVYADAIAVSLKLPDMDRLVLKDAAQYIRERPIVPRDGTLSDFGQAHRNALVETVLYYREHWDGRGGTPGAVGGAMIPATSRVLAVAAAWSKLTALGSPRLSHGQALNQLEARAGMHFDPAVVKAAMHVVRWERLGRATDGAWEPRLHRMRLPRLVRWLGAVTMPSAARISRSADHARSRPQEAAI